MYSTIEIAQKIKELAVSKGIVLQKMFADLNFTANTMTNLYDGRMIKSDRLAKIADYLDCSVDYLLGRIPQQKYSIDLSTLNSNEQTMLNTFRHLSLLDQHAAIKHLQFLLSESSPTQSISTNTTSTAARNDISDTPIEINDNDLETTISQASEQE